MNKPNKTYSESGKFYAVITLINGYTYYSGPFNSRSTARRHAIQQMKHHQWAFKNGMIYNTKGM